LNPIKFSSLGILSISKSILLSLKINIANADPIPFVGDILKSNWISRDDDNNSYMKYNINMI